MNEKIETSQRDAWSAAKRFLVLFAAATVLLAGVAVIHYYVVMKTERIERETSELLNVELGKAAIARDLGNAISDLMFMARHNEPQGLFENGDSKSRRVLAEQFLVFSAQKRKYDQIRFLDRTGMEVVRLNYNNGDPIIVRDDQLQNKAQRYYFAKTLGLAPGDMYISPFDLNIERGRIEQPLKPMIRFGTPVLDRLGRKNGILLFNYLGERLIGAFRRATANISGHVMLLNSDGYWLSSPRSDDEWGFMYDNNRTLAKAHLNSWQRIQAEDSGQFYDDEGMFSFTTIYPLLYATGRSWSGGQSGSLAADRGYHWKVVSHLSSQSLSAVTHKFFALHSPLYAAMLGLLAVASLLIARTSVRHKQAVSQVTIERRVRGSLEEKVDERTQELKETQAEKDQVVQQLIQAEKMAAIGTMVSGIGHEINNPLYAILGKAEAIRVDADVSRCRGYGQDIVAHSKQIAEIVKNLSGYARPSEEQDFELADVNEKLSEAISMARRSLLDDQVKIEENLLPVPGISANSEEIQQVFFNVIRNGIQAVGKEGLLEITSRQEEDRILIRIQDTGEGIPEQNLGKVFDPFFTTRGPDQGEGLGLFITQQIVKKYAGTITFESRKGEGTVCTIEFPVEGGNERRNRNENCMVLPLSQYCSAGSRAKTTLRE